MYLEMIKCRKPQRHSFKNIIASAFFYRFKCNIRNMITKINYTVKYNLQKNIYKKFN